MSVRRRLVNLLTALSLLLCAATVAGVAYTYWSAHDFNWAWREVAGDSARETRWVVHVAWGRVRIERARSTRVYTSGEVIDDLLRRQGSRRQSFFHHGSERAAAPSDSVGSPWARLGFHWYRSSVTIPWRPLANDRGPVSSTVDRTELAVPVWPLGLFGVLPPLIWSLRAARRRRARANARRGICAACDYDLRASPGLCPECGAPPATIA